MLLPYVYFRFHRDHFWPVNAIDNANTYRVFKYQKPKNFLLSMFPGVAFIKVSLY